MVSTQLCPDHFRLIPVGFSITDKGLVRVADLETCGRAPRCAIAVDGSDVRVLLEPGIATNIELADEIMKIANRYKNEKSTARVLEALAWEIDRCLAIAYSLGRIRFDVARVDGAQWVAT